MVDFLTKSTKWIVFIFNLLFTLIGLAVAAFGIALQVKLIHLEILPNDLNAVSITIIVTGFVIFLIPFLGCCGAITENRCMLFSFSIIMTLVLLFEIGVGITAYEKRDWIKDQLGQSLNETLIDIGNDATLKKPWDNLQKEFKCCGVNSMDDWKVVTDTLPTSCCENAEGTDCVKENAWKTGCKDALVNYVNDNLAAIVAITFGLLTFQLVGIILGCCLFSVFGQRNFFERILSTQ